MSRKRTITRILLPTLLGLALLGPVGALAAGMSFGSGLSATANRAYAHGVDTAFWPRSISGGRATAPAKGRLATIYVKGCAVQNGSRAPLTQFHVQVLRPIGGGAVKVMITGGPFNLPVCGHGGGASTVSSYQGGNLCVHKGDYVAFNDEGGFGPGYPKGVSYKVLATASGSSTMTFTGANRTNNGAVLRGRTLSGVELLMKMKLLTGSAAGVCQVV